MDGVVCATTVWICCFLVWKEGARVVLHVLARDIMFDAFLPYLSSPGVAGTTILSFASVKIYILFTLLFTLYYTIYCTIYTLLLLLKIPYHKV